MTTSMAEPAYDAVVVGAGPNGLAAAITLAQAGRSVCVVEAAPEAGGGLRTAELTEPGFRHDVCSAVHPTGVLSPFFASLPLQAHGLQWCYPGLSVAHPMDDGDAVVLQRDMAETAAGLGPDGAAYQKLIAPFTRYPEDLFHDLLGPLRIPRRPFQMARFGLLGMRSAMGLARRFEGPRARALFGGCAAHSILPFDKMPSAALGLVFCTSGHLVDWPVARGGSSAIAQALVSYLQSLGGNLVLNRPVGSLADLPESRAVLFDLAPRQLIQIAGDSLPSGYRRRLERYLYGPAVFKLDYALSGPIPWKDPRCAEASTIHLGGTMEELAASERSAWRGEHSERPFVLLCQQSHFDDSRAPAGKHTGYAYCHVPYGSTVDMTSAIEDQIERFAPGFRDLIVARAPRGAAQIEADNGAHVGGTITGGAATLGQLFTRPVARLDPYTTPNPRLFMCGAATPPGGGVHGMCGHFAAKSALRRVLR